MKKTLLLFVLLFSQAALACWKIDGSFAIDGETYKFSQKIDHNKEYKIGGGVFILSFTVKELNKTNSEVKYKIEEKKGTKLTLVTFGSEEVENKKSNDIFAKGEEGQPNTIITVKLTDI